MKSLINFALLKEQLKRFWSIAALSLLAYLLFIVLPIYRPSDDKYEPVRQMIYVLGMESPVLIAASILIPLFTVFVMFSYLFQAKATTVMYAWPISKDQLLFSNFWAGLILFAVPLLILCLCMMAPVTWLNPEMSFDASGVPYYVRPINVPIEIFQQLRIGDTINTFPIVLVFFLRNLLCYYIFGHQHGSQS